MQSEMCPTRTGKKIEDESVVGFPPPVDELYRLVLYDSNIQI